MKRDTRDSIERQLVDGTKLKFEEVARKAYGEGGWSDERFLEEWLTLVYSDDDARKMLRLHSHEIVWILETPSPADVVTKIYKIVLWTPWGPRMSWGFYVDDAGYVRGYTVVGAVDGD